MLVCERTVSWVRHPEPLCVRTAADTGRLPTGLNVNLNLRIPRDLIEKGMRKPGGILPRLPLVLFAVPRWRHRWIKGVTAGCALCGFLAVGCGGGSNGTTPTPAPTPPQASFTVAGTVSGDGQPLAGAEVQLYVAGASGYGTGATELGEATVTGENGTFTLTGDLNCPSKSVPAYVTATGGQAGSGKTNPAITLMAPLGSCGDLTTASVTLNELTTVASVWALSPFLGSGGTVGTSSGNAQGLTNAFAMINSLVNPTTGAAPGSAPGNARVPTAKMDTLADILAACVGSSSACTTLFTAATPAAGSAPDDTLDAALEITRNPGSSVAALFALSSTTAPFQPSLSAAPPDWTLAVSYSGGGLDTPGAIAVDAAGNVWAANYFGSVTGLSATGQALSSSTGFTGGSLNESYGLAVNSDGSVWVTDEQTSSTVNNGDGNITVLNSSGQVTSGSSGYFGGGVFFPLAIAADTDGSVWIADYGDSVASKLSLSGAAISGSGGYGSSQLQGPVAVAIDGGHNAWFANQASGSGMVTSISSDGSQINTISTGGEAPSGIATDVVSAGGGTGHVWVANYYSNSVSEITLGSGGTAVVTSTGYTGGGLNHPNGLAVDGAGNVWVANYRGNSITELEGASATQPGASLSGNAGFGTDASLSAPFAVAIDAGGNLWVSNQGSSTITEFLGVAAPVKTPLLGPPQLP